MGNEILEMATRKWNTTMSANLSISAVNAKSFCILCPEVSYGLQERKKNGFFIKGLHTPYISCKILSFWKMANKRRNIFI